MVEASTGGVPEEWESDALWRPHPLLPIFCPHAFCSPCYTLVPPVGRGKKNFPRENLGFSCWCLCGRMLRKSEAEVVTASLCLLCFHNMRCPLKRIVKVTQSTNFGLTVLCFSLVNPPSYLLSNCLNTYYLSLVILNHLFFHLPCNLSFVLQCIYSTCNLEVSPLNLENSVCIEFQL